VNYIRSTNHSSIKKKNKDPPTIQQTRKNRAQEPDLKETAINLIDESLPKSTQSYLNS
jgi:hypothetical protein